MSDRERVASSAPSEATDDAPLAPVTTPIVGPVDRAREDFRLRIRRDRNKLHVIEHLAEICAEHEKIYDQIDVSRSTSEGHKDDKTQKRGKSRVLTTSYSEKGQPGAQRVTPVATAPMSRQMQRVQRTAEPDSSSRLDHESDTKRLIERAKAKRALAVNKPMTSGDRIHESRKKGLASCCPYCARNTALSDLERFRMFGANAFANHVVTQHIITSRKVNTICPECNADVHARDLVPHLEDIHSFRLGANGTEKAGKDPTKLAFSADD